jgi:hypothetical protein
MGLVPVSSSFEAFLRGRLTRARTLGMVSVAEELEAVLAAFQAARMTQQVQHRDPVIHGE